MSLSPTRLPSTQALLCFEAAERLGSLTRAAAELHLTQGAVSRQLQALEARVQTPLFVRHPQRLVLSPAGRSFLADVRPVLLRLARAVSDLQAHQGLGGRLRLSVASTFATHWLIPRLPSFTEAHPDITLDLATRIGPVDFLRADVDAAITYISAPLPPAQGVLLVPLRLRPYASPALLRSLRQAARAGGDSLAQPSRSKAGGQGVNPALNKWPWLETAPLLVNVSVPDGWAAWASAAGVSAPRVAQLRQRAAARYDLLSMALNAALAGIGVALLPHFLAEQAVAEKRLVALAPLQWTAPNAYHLTYPPEHAQLPALQRFSQWLLEQAKASHG
jgi:LysR family transcriptional regulator, glycine cleavage system transcriptional activator